MIFVTGGTGFLGAYILQNLVRKGQEVRALRRSRSLPFFLPEDIASRIEWIEGDIFDPMALAEGMEGAEGVIHSAALVSFHRADSHQMYRVNIEGTANVVNAAIDAGVRRFLHVSSVAALGRTTKEELVNEEKKWAENANNTHYAISKYHAEIEVWRGFAEGLEGVIINPSTILGFGNWHGSSCAIFRNAYRQFPWYTNGINGFVGVEDVAEAAVALLFSHLSERRFIVNGDNWSFRQLFNTIAEGFHKPPPHREATSFMGQVAWRLEKIKSLLGGRRPLLTRETAKVAQSRTRFDNGALLQALPGFCYTPLEEVIKEACGKYEEALKQGLLTL